MKLGNNAKDLFQGGAQGLFRGPNQSENQQWDSFAGDVQAEEQTEKPNWMLDVATAPLRGLEGTAHGVYNLLDTIAFDALPNWNEGRVFGESKTMVGGFVEGLSQFLIPFFPLKAALKLGQAGKAFSKLGTKGGDIARDVTAGAIVDFTAFHGGEERLSNLINQAPALKNDVTEFLEAKEDDAEVEGRIKNTLEGLLIEGTMRGSFGAVGAAMRGIKAIKRYRRGIADGKPKEEAAADGVNEIDEADYDQMDFLDTFDADEGYTLKVVEDADQPFLARTDRKGAIIKFNTPAIQQDWEDGLPYMRGLTEGVGSAQKKIVFEDIDIDQFKEALGSPERYKEFIKHHEEGHIKLHQSEKYDFKNLENPYNVALEREVNEYAARQMGLDWKGLHKEGAYKEVDDLKLDAQQDNFNVGRPDEAKRIQGLTYQQMQTEAKELGIGGRGTKLALKNKLLNHYENKPFSTDETGQGQMFADQGMGKETPLERTKEFKDAEKLQTEQPKSTIEDQNLEQPHFWDDMAKFDREKPIEYKESHQQSLERTVAEVRADLKKEPVKGKRGAVAALSGSIRNVADTGGLMILAKALALEIEEGAEVTVKSFDDIKADAENMSDEMGLGGPTAYDHFAKIQDAYNKDKKARASGEVAHSMDRVRAEQAGLRKLNRQIAIDLKDKADEMFELKERGGQKGDTDYHVLETELLTLVDKMTASQQLWSVYGKEIAEGMLQRKAYYVGTRYNKRLGLSGQQVLNGADRAAYKKQRIGSMTTDELVKALRGQTDPDKLFKTMNKVAAGTQGSKAMNITMEYWMNSLLSSPLTQGVNLLGAAGIYHLKAAEGMVGGILGGDKAVAKGIATNIYKLESIKEAWAWAKHSLKTDQPVLTPDARMYDDTADRGHAIASEKEGTFGDAINFIGTIVRSPSRALLAGDEFFKQLNYRFFIRSEAYANALKKGSSPEEAAKAAEVALDMSLTGQGRHLSDRAIGMEAYEFVNRQDELRMEAGKPRFSAEERDQELKRYFVKHDGGLRAPLTGMDQADPRLRLPDAGLAYAKEGTATTDIPSIQEPLGRLAHYFPPAKMVFPFVRTPTNLLKMGFERTALGSAAQFIREASHGEFLERLKKTNDTGTAREKAQLKGMMATTAATTYGLVSYVYMNGEWISGMGPKNRDESKALRASGWQPYSIRIGDKWFSYRRMDPISTTLGILADMAEAPKYHDLDDPEVNGLMTVGMTAFMNNITNQSFVEGIKNLFDVASDPSTFGTRFVGSLAGGFVPNIVNHTQNLGEDKMLRETRSWFDHVLARVPSQSSKLPPRRNFMGEAQMIENGAPMLGAVNPFYFSNVSKNPEDVEISRLLHGFQMPNSKIGGASALDLKNMQTPQGQDAYDRYLELSSTTKVGGKTLREQLRGLVENPNYKLLPEESIASDTGLRSPRVNEINKILRFYRLSARMQLMKEMPELQQMIASNDQKKQTYLQQ